MKHENLTNKVMRLMLQKQKILLNQLENVTMVEETDDVGYFVSFSFPDSKPTMLNKKIELPNVVGKNKNGEYVVGFVLFIKNGLIDCLEGYTFGEQKWPDSDEDISLEIEQ